MATTETPWRGRITPLGVRFAHPEDVRSAILDYPENYRECRVNVHQLRPHNILDYKGGSWDEITKCRNCGSKRTRQCDSRGVTIGYHWDYSDGFLMTIGRLDAEGRGVMRLAHRENFRAQAVKNRAEDPDEAPAEVPAKRRTGGKVFSHG